MNVLELYKAKQLFEKQTTELFNIHFILTSRINQLYKDQTKKDLRIGSNSFLGDYVSYIVQEGHNSFIVEYKEIEYDSVFKGTTKLDLDWYNRLEDEIIPYGIMEEMLYELTLQYPTGTEIGDFIYGLEVQEILKTPIYLDLKEGVELYKTHYIQVYEKESAIAYKKLPVLFSDLPPKVRKRYIENDNSLQSAELEKVLRSS